MCKDIETSHHCNSGIYAREMHLPSGWEAESHVHLFDHMSILSSGVAIVTVDGISTEYTAPTVINIQADKVHKVHALSDVVWFCLHPSDSILDDSILIREV